MTNGHTDGVGPSAGAVVPSSGDVPSGKSASSRCSKDLEKNHQESPTVVRAPCHRRGRGSPPATTRPQGRQTVRHRTRPPTAPSGHRIQQLRQLDLGTVPARVRRSGAGRLLRGFGAVPGAVPARASRTHRRSHRRGADQLDPVDARGDVTLRLRVSDSGSRRHTCQAADMVLRPVRWQWAGSDRNWWSSPREEAS